MMFVKKRKKTICALIFCLLPLICVTGCGTVREYFYEEPTCRGLSRPTSGYVTIARPKNTKMTYEMKCRALYNRYGVVVPDKKPDFNELRSTVNPDIYAWIYLPDTNVDYPVVQHAYDNAYYLDYNYDGTKGYPGCIYTENLNAKDFSDPMTVIYGHNMNSGVMFATLFNYTDQQFYADHPYIYIYTEDDIFVYRIFSAGPHDDGHILHNNDYFTREDSLVNYLDYTGTDGSVSYSNNSHALVLSTCVNTVANQRFLVQGLLLDFSEQ